MNRIFIIIIIALATGTCYSQELSDSTLIKTPVDSTGSNVFENPPDTTVSSVIDTSRQIISDIDAPINYSAKDSLIFDTKNKKVYLYNEAKLTYKDLKLEAGRIIV